MEQKQTRKPRVLITYIESGFGHIMSARAIADGLKSKYGDKLEIVESQIMRDDNDPRLIKFEKFLTNQTKATNKLWHYGDLIFGVMNLGRQPFMNLVHRVFFKRAVASLVQAFRKREPDIIISTHYFVTYAAMEYKRRYSGEHNVTVVCYDPDNNVHIWWDKRSDLFITNNSLASEEAIDKRKFDPKHVAQVYFTVRKCVKDFNLTKSQCRQKYGINQNNFCIMIADGGYAGGKGKKYCKYIVKHATRPITVLFLAGTNNKAYNKFKRLSSQLNNGVTLVPLKFSDEIYELYAAADLLVTKAGPNTLLDSLFVDTPVMVDHCPHPIERATCRLFVDHYGCGVSAFNPRKASELINKYAADPQLLAPYHQAIAQYIDKTIDGGEQIADLVYSQVQSKIETQNL